MQLITMLLIRAAALNYRVVFIRISIRSLVAVPACLKLERIIEMEHDYFISDSGTKTISRKTHFGEMRISSVALEISLSETLRKGKGGWVSGRWTRTGEDALP